MDELIIRVLQGRATDAEERELQRWRSTSSLNEAHFREVERMWDLLGIVEPPATPHPRAAWDARLETVAPVAHGPAEVIRGRRGWLWGVAAAVAMIAVGSGVFHSTGTAGDRLESAEFVTAADENATVRLDDGSVVRLGPESRVRVSATESERGVWLDGQAFFAVAHDPQRPFVVRTDAGEARVLGTRFDVRVRDRAMTVLVVEGKVSVSGEGKELEVGPRQMSYQETGSEPSLVTVEDPERMLGWMGRFLVFQSTPLHRVAAEIEAKYGVRVELADSFIADRTITAWFTDQDVQEVLMTVCRVANVQCSIGTDVVTMIANGQ